MSRQDWLLLLDDYHLITNPAVHQALDTLLGQPTCPARFVLTSRGLPPLAAIARLRVEGRLLELDEADLRFTPEEAHDLLAGSGLSLDEALLRLVAARTEGWPVALQLLRQAAQRQTAPDLAALLGRIGDERPLFDYLAGQVLERQPADLQSFLPKGQSRNPGQNSNCWRSCVGRPGCASDKAATPRPSLSATGRWTICPTRRRTRRTLGRRPPTSLRTPLA